MLERVSGVIKIIPLFLLISTGIQLLIYDCDWYSPVYYLFIYHFHSYGIFVNLALFYYSRKFADSLSSDLSIIGLIMMNILCMGFYILNDGQPIQENQQIINIMIWDSVISIFFLLMILTAWYLERKKVTNWFTKLLNYGKK